MVSANGFCFYLLQNILRVLNGTGTQAFLLCGCWCKECTVVELGNVDGHEVGQVLEDDHDAVEEDIVHGTFNGDLVAFKDLRLVIQKPEQDVTEGNSSVSHHSCGEVCQESNHVFCLTIHLRTCPTFREDKH
eukprot:449713-Amphidinium_carterae.1